MKNIITSLAIGTILLATSCEEKIPAGLILKQTIIAKDSTYIDANIPAAQPKNILIEEFTGVTCSNCPKGAVDLKAIEVANAPRILVAKIHSSLQAIPIDDDVDLRCADADALAASLGLQAKPSASVDRLQNSGSDYTFFIPAVSGKVAAQLPKKSFVNITLVKELNTTKDSITLSATLTFTDTTSRKLAYQIYVLEDDVETKQDSVSTVNAQKYVIEKYIHEKVLRKTITPAFVGTSLPDTLHEKGRVYLRGLQFVKPSNVLKIDHCVVLVFVNDRLTNEVIQCQEIHL
jgi:Outer membrane protein Omp28